MFRRSIDALMRGLKHARFLLIDVRSPAKLYRNYGKRLVDIVGAFFLLIILSPIILVLLALVSIDGSSPIFGHKRIGRNGNIFRCWKVRTMVPDAEKRLNDVLAADHSARLEWSETRKLRNDPRITLVGSFLRSTSLDELPQFWNVLVGDMSLVGPRPVTADELVLYGDAAKSYKSLRPGITGPWQVSGRGEVNYDTRIRMDSRYASDISAFYDVMILARTTSVVLARTGT